MKKTFIFCLLLTAALSLCACGRQSPDVSIDYGSSSVYSTADIDSAVAVIKAEFSEFEGCVLHALRYGGDDAARSNLDYCRSLDEGKDFTQCMVFDSSFHSPVKGGGAWEADTEYTWTWYLAREADGAWCLLTYGYC